MPNRPTGAAISLAHMPEQIPPKELMKADARVLALALETGATEAQIRSIIELVGSDRGSILREARYLAKTASS